MFLSRGRLVSVRGSTCLGLLGAELQVTLPTGFAMVRYHLLPHSLAQERTLRSRNIFVPTPLSSALSELRALVSALRKVPLTERAEVAHMVRAAVDEVPGARMDPPADASPAPVTPPTRRRAAPPALLRVRAPGLKDVASDLEEGEIPESPEFRALNSPRPQKRRIIPASPERWREPRSPDAPLPKKHAAVAQELEESVRRMGALCRPVVSGAGTGGSAVPVLAMFKAVLE